MSPERNTTDDVLHAARASVLEVGVRRTTLSDVARRAGVSRMTVYRQFQDAPSLLTTVLTRELGAHVETATVAVRDLPTARERLVAAALDLLDRLGCDPFLRRVLDLDPELLLPFLVDRQGSSQRAIVAVVRDQLTAGIADGSVHVADVDAAAYVVQLTVQSFVLASRIPAPAGVRQELAALLDRYLNGQP